MFPVLFHFEVESITVGVHLNPLTLTISVPAVCTSCCLHLRFVAYVFYLATKATVAQEFTPPEASLNQCQKGVWCGNIPACSPHLVVTLKYTQIFSLKQNVVMASNNLLANELVIGCLSFPLSHSFSLLTFPEMFSQISNLNLNTCFRICFWGYANYQQIQDRVRRIVLNHHSGTSFLRVQDLKSFILWAKRSFLSLILGS